MTDYGALRTRHAHQPRMLWIIDAAEGSGVEIIESAWCPPGVMVGKASEEMGAREQTVVVSKERAALLTKEKTTLAQLSLREGITRKSDANERVNWMFQKAAEARADLKEHRAAVGAFLGEMYAVLVDPLAEGPMKVAETCKRLLDAAKEDRQRLQDLSDALLRFGQHKDFCASVGRDMDSLCNCGFMNAREGRVATNCEVCGYRKVMSVDASIGAVEICPKCSGEEK